MTLVAVNVLSIIQRNKLTIVTFCNSFLSSLHYAITLPMLHRLGTGA